MTDLDGTMLSHDTFDFSPIKRGIKELQKRGITIIPASSKTRAEVEMFCYELGEELVFIFENGAGIVNSQLLLTESSTASNAFPFHGKSVSQLRASWKKKISASLRSHCQFLFTMESEMQTHYLGLSGKDLTRALDRQFSIPFIFTGPPNLFSQLQDEASQAGLTVQCGGRVCNLSGPHSKAIYVEPIRRLASKKGLAPIIVGFGDGLNDYEMLVASDIACVIPRSDGSSLEIDKDANDVIIAEREAPQGWLDAAQEALLRLEK